VKQYIGITGLILVCIVLMSGRVIAGPCRAAPSRCVPTEGELRRSIRLRIYRNFLVIVEGQFGESDTPKNFILDTGTAPSIINERFVKKLGLAEIASTMSIIGKLVPAKSAMLPELLIGPIRATNVHVQIQDMSAVERNLGVPLAGIVGLDVLGRQNFRLDYDKTTLTFDDQPADGISVPVDTHTGLAVASVNLEGKTARMLVDTGSDQVALFAASIKDAAGLTLHNSPHTGASVSDVSLAVQVFFRPDIVLGGRHYSVEKAYFVSGKDDPGFDGLLGVRALGFRAIAYNHEHEMLYLQK
jgi:hypothetical protein